VAEIDQKMKRVFCTIADERKQSVAILNRSAIELFENLPVEGVAALF